MPLAKVKLGPEEPLADAALYSSVRNDNPSSVLHGVAMAGLVGAIRHLAEL